MRKKGKLRCNASKIINDTTSLKDHSMARFQKNKRKKLFTKLYLGVMHILKAIGAGLEKKF